MDFDRLMCVVEFVEVDLLGMQLDVFFEETGVQ